MSNQVFVLLSGGIDSTTCCALACRDYGRENVTALSILYGQRHSKEVTCASNIAAYFDIKHEVHHITIPQSGLSDPDQVIPDCDYKDLKGVSPTFVAFRNGQMLSYAAGIAAARVAKPNVEGDTGVIYIGAHAEDAAGDAYPDCNLEFIGAMAAAIYIGTYFKVRLVAPLIQMRKYQVVYEGYKLGAPYDLSWSCYRGTEMHCGTCPTCRARIAAFNTAGVPDPTLYAN